MLELKLKKPPSNKNKPITLIPKMASHQFIQPVNDTWLHKSCNIAKIIHYIIYALEKRKENNTMCPWRNPLIWFRGMCLSYSIIRPSTV